MRFTYRKIVFGIENNGSVHGCTIICLERQVVVFVVVFVRGCCYNDRQGSEQKICLAHQDGALSSDE